ncbi:glycosyl hydrolase family 28-related protein [Kiritimatiella glycovorans]|uniref:Uncharacterized protein n=1 Tax=Kiritimatiella glycovorans TaxID=1307763 RepID=A0A0G3EFJ1_9BACT|nr:glycosyl hydrolase family 28-related protein [Kiritimatiella glycovorans]AKJ64172.1 hypothetical protein L21SP4_00909 [Kiritimatiella glycovorans]
MTTRSGQYFRSRGLRRTRAVVCLLLGAVLSAHARTEVDVVADFGAVANDGIDDAPAFQDALDYLNSTGGGTLHVPPGRFLFNERVSVEARDWRLTIQGDPLGETELQVDNPDGLFQLTHSTRYPQVNIRDLSITALREAAGTALEVTCPQGGVQEKRVVTLRKLEIRGNGGAEYFNRGIVIGGLYRPLIENCSVVHSTAADMSDSSPNFLPEVGIDVTDCYAPVIERCSVVGARVAYLYDSAENPEDGAVRDCTADYCRVGVRYFHDNGSGGKEETLWINDSDIRARDAGVEVKGRRILHISGNTFRRLSETHPLKDVTIEIVTMGFVTDNTFEGNLDAGRKNVSVLDDVTKYVVIIDNTLSGPFASALYIHPDAQNILSQ